MLPSFLCTIAAGGCAIAASFIRNRVHQLVVVVVAVLFWFTVWCLLIEPMYLLFAVFAGWLALVVTLASVFMQIAKRITPLKKQHNPIDFHPNCRCRIVPSPFAPYRPIHRPLTQEDIDSGNHPQS